MLCKSYRRSLFTVRLFKPSVELCTHYSFLGEALISHPGFLHLTAESLLDRKTETSVDANQHELIPRRAFRSQNRLFPWLRQHDLTITTIFVYVCLYSNDIASFSMLILRLPISSTPR